MSTKISELPAASAANLTDLLAKVNDPSGTPVTQKLTISQLQTLLTGGVKRYVALMSQTGANDPVVTVLENTIGAIVWGRSDVGVYEAALSNAFPVGKVALLVQGYSSIDPEATNDFVHMRRAGNDGVTLITASAGTFSGLPGPADGVLVQTTVSITVYP